MAAAPPTKIPALVVSEEFVAHNQAAMRRIVESIEKTESDLRQMEQAKRTAEQNLVRLRAMYEAMQATATLVQQNVRARVELSPAASTTTTS